MLRSALDIFMLGRIVLNSGSCHRFDSCFLNKFMQWMPHLLYFFYPYGREEDNPSECAVPVSTALIKQIATKSNTNGTIHEIFNDFYGCSSSPQSIWPYTKKDFARYHSFWLFLFVVILLAVAEVFLQMTRDLEITHV